MVIFLRKIRGKFIVPALAWHAGAPTGAAVQAAVDHAQQRGRPTVLGVSHHQRSPAVTVARILPTYRTSTVTDHRRGIFYCILRWKSQR